MRNILHIGLSCMGGGLENCVMNYFRALSEAEICFDFADIHGDGIAGEAEILARGGAIYSAGNYKKNPLGVFRSLVSLMHQNHYNAVHIHMLSAANLIPVFAAKKAGIPLVIHSHNTDCSGTARRIMHAAGCRILRRIPAIRLGCSEAACEWMWGSRESAVLPNAMDLHAFAFSPEARSRTRRQLGLDDDVRVLGFLGRLEYAKNIPFLLDTLGAVAAQIPNTVLMIVGSGSMEAELRSRARQLGLENKVIFAGFQKNTADWYSAMDVFLMPSFFEGLPLSGIEAQASGLPCLFSAAITEELKQTDRARFLAIGGNQFAAWAEAIINCLREKADRIATGQSMLQSPYNIHTSAAQLRTIYEECCG